MNQNQPTFSAQPEPGATPPDRVGSAAPTGQTVMRRVSLPQSIPYVTYAIMGMTTLVFLLQMATQSLLGVDYPAALGMKANDLIMRGQYWRLITPVLLHGSILHIGFNMYALYIFGPGLERHYGRWRFLILYLLGGFAGNVLSFVFSPAYSLGSSTAIFGLLGAEGVFLYQNRELFGKNAQRALVNIVVVGAANLVIGMYPGIDNWGHVGGLLGGVSFAWLAGPLLKVGGVFPALQFDDQRDAGDIFRAAIGVGVIFAIVALVTIYWRGG
jgi:rhomboid protease GluP